MGTLAEGIKEIFATAKTTGSNVMLCGNDGTPDGHMTMANLASVLRVPKDYGRVDDVSFNIDTLINTTHEFSILEFGSSHTIGGTIPSGIAGWATLLTICPDVEGTQYLFDATQRLFVRKSDNGAIGQWNEVGINIPLFYKDYNNLSALASALGVLKAYGNIDFTGDLNTIMGNYYLRVTPSATNNPTGGYAQLISIGGSIGSSRIGVFQICFQYQLRSDIYVRAYSDDTWSAWKKITLTSIS